MMGFGWQEMLIVLVIVLVIFGAGKLPSVMKSMGAGVKEFKTESGAAPVAAESSSLGSKAEESAA